MLRNLSNEKSFPSRPTRFCLKTTGEPVSNIMAQEIARRMGERIMSSNAARVLSKTCLAVCPAGPGSDRAMSVMLVNPEAGLLKLGEAERCVAVLLIFMPN
jgi:hypothetical protein